MLLAVNRFDIQGEAGVERRRLSFRRLGHDQPRELALPAERHRDFAPAGGLEGGDDLRIAPGGRDGSREAPRHR
eukprot:3704317-Alexandrium_andersonii.AAC.1